MAHNVLDCLTVANVAHEMAARAAGSSAAAVLVVALGLALAVDASCAQVPPGGAVVATTVDARQQPLPEASARFERLVDSPPC